MSKKTNMTISFDETQMELFDFVLTVINHGIHSRTSYFLSNVRDEVKGFIDLPDDISLPDDQLLNMAINKHENNIKSVMGEENYKKFVERKDI